MSQKIGVLAHYQHPFEAPRSHVSKTVADFRVQNKTARRVSKLVIQMIEGAIVCESQFHPTYIPEKMPPREVPGCFFQPPQSDTWKLQHRTVTFAQ
jgi:hypothetical protein